MFGTGRFHDENYDGVVLKIPRWFIDMNELGEAFDAFEKALKGANKSKFYLDHVNNLHELENREEKHKQVSERKEKEAKERKLVEDRQRKIVAGEIYETDWVKESWCTNTESIKIGDKYYDFEDYSTNKYSIKASFLKEVMPLLSSYEAIKQFALRNCMPLYNDMNRVPAEFLDLNISFYMSRADGHLGVSYGHLTVRTDITESKKSNGSYRYRKARLIRFEDGCLGLDKGGNEDAAIRLDGYIKDGKYLVKQKPKQNENNN